MSGVDEVSRLLGQLLAGQQETFKRLGELEQAMEDMTAIKNKGWGVVMGVGVLSAFVGAKLSAVLAAFGGMVK